MRSSAATVLRLVAGLLAACALIAAPARAHDPADAVMAWELAALMTGEFDSREQMGGDDALGITGKQRHFHVNRAFLPVVSELSGPVLVGSTFYGREQWIFDRIEFFIWTFEPVAGGVLATPRRFKDQQKREAFARDPARLAGFDESDLEAAIGGGSCQILWRRAEDGFVGESKPCRVRSVVYEQMVTWTWRYHLTKDAMFIEYDGFDDAGELVDGTPRGVRYRLDRIG